MKIRCLILAIACALPACAPAQQVRAEGGEFNFLDQREPVASLDGQWRFHLGDDDPQWAAPGFDDSNWPLIETGKSWNEQGYAGISGYAWYRARIAVPSGATDLSLLVPYVLTSYQIFANGKLLGGVGGMPPREWPISQFRAYATYRIPQPDAGSHSVILAFRVWHSPLWQGLIRGGIYPGLEIGSTPAIEEHRRLERTQQLWSHASDFCLALIALLAALASLSFFWRNRSQKEYLWFAMGALMSIAVRMAAVGRQLLEIDVLAYNLVNAFLSFAAAFAFIQFLRILLAAKREWLYRMVIASIAANMLLLFVVAGFPLVFRTNLISITTGNAASTVLDLIPSIWIVGLLFRRAAQRHLDARLLLAPVLLQQFAVLADHAEWLFRFAAGWEPSAFKTFDQFWDRPFPISVPNLCDLFFLGGMLAIFVHRFLRTARTQDAYQRELESARTVQQVLVPEEIPTIARFDLAAFFRPFGEVGGDFYQIVPTSSGGVLVVIGDVSGKGMPAAMTVSLLVGTFRTLAHYTQSPAEILRAMNQRMIGRNSGGFTTCLVARVNVDGNLTAANAGHLPPYLDGDEIELVSGLPLGLAAGSEYPETQFTLPPGARLTLLTDGVVEARNPSGELFGFDRTAALSTQSAEAIAHAAQQFGQEDDITVLTLTFAPAEVLHA